MKLIKFCLVCVIATPVLAQELMPNNQAEIVESKQQINQNYLQPRPLNSIAKGEFGDKVRLGYQLFVNTQQLKGRFVGNELNCVNCHMNAGRQANAGPLWAAYFSYPAFRHKNDKVNSFQERIQGCFTYSMNGTAPPSDSEELIALSAYSYWLSMSGLLEMAKSTKPVAEVSDKQLLAGGKVDDFPLDKTVRAILTGEQLAKLPGKGYPSIAAPKQDYSPERGKEVYQQYCQACHGENGQGYRVAEIYSLPPLWGDNSYNWGAGMHRINTAANFIYANMPLGNSMQLTNQQAWDVAAFINAQERPQDPRFKGDVKALQQTYHQHLGYYGKTKKPK